MRYRNSLVSTLDRVAKDEGAVKLSESAGHLASLVKLLTELCISWLTLYELCGGREDLIRQLVPCSVAINCEYKFLLHNENGWKPVLGKNYV